MNTEQISREYLRKYTETSNQKGSDNTEEQLGREEVNKWIRNTLDFLHHEEKKNAFSNSFYVYHMLHS